MQFGKYFVPLQPQYGLFPKIDRLTSLGRVSTFTVSQESGKVWFPMG